MFAGTGEGLYPAGRICKPRMPLSPASDVATLSSEPSVRPLACFLSIWYKYPLPFASRKCIPPLSHVWPLVALNPVSL